MTARSVVLLVGAGRSGTNFVALVLGAHSGIINGYENRFIWNIGQPNKLCDWRAPEESTFQVRDAITRALFSMAPAGHTLIDKSPGNALRLDFVRAVLPDVKILNIVRDGRASPGLTNSNVGGCCIQIPI